MVNMSVSSIISLAVLLLIYNTECSYNIVDKFVTSTKGVEFRVKTQNYKRRLNKYLRQEAIADWHFLMPEPLEMTLPQCGKACLQKEDCTGFFFFKTKKLSCAMNEVTVVNTTHFVTDDTVDYYEIEVYVFFFNYFLV